MSSLTLQTVDESRGAAKATDILVAKKPTVDVRPYTEESIATPRSSEPAPRSSKRGRGHSGADYQLAI